MRGVRGAGRRAVGRSPGRAPGPSALDTCTAQQVRRVHQDTCPDRRCWVFDGRGAGSAGTGAALLPAKSAGLRSSLPSDGATLDRFPSRD